MRHIKLFEGFNTEDYYKEITYLEYCNSDTVNFEQKYYEKLNRYYRDQVFSAEPSLERDGDDILMVRFNTYESGYYVNIYQTDDEWFLVYMRTTSDFSYFKCDQYEGLIKCLDEEIKEHYED